MIVYTGKEGGDTGILPADTIAGPECSNCGSQYIVLTETQQARV